ncbi:MAG: LysR substrate-binding domain-containing protein [Leptolyngbya sp. BL-A-14]
MLDEDQIDLAIGFYPHHASWHRQQVLFAEEFICVCRQNHPSVQPPLTLETYLEAAHLLVSLREDRTGRIDQVLANQNVQRHITLTIPHFLLAGFILARTDLLAALPKRLAQVGTQFLPLQFLPLPMQVSGFALSILWHSKSHDEAGHQWLRSLCVSIEKSLCHNFE